MITQHVCPLSCIHLWLLPPPHSKTKGFENEERLVYQIIEDSSNKGIWVRDIRYKSNLVQTQLMRILRSLESRKLIKSVKSVQATKRKVYMLYELSPDESVTGGAWYSDQDFESEFVEVLNKHCLKFLKQKVCVSSCVCRGGGLVGGCYLLVFVLRFSFSFSSVSYQHFFS